MNKNKESIEEIFDTSFEDEMIERLKEQQARKKEFRKTVKLNEKITFFRIQAGLSKSQLARAVNVSPAYITLIEKGTNTPSAPLLNKIARAFGISYEELAGRKTFNLDEMQIENDSRILIPFNKLNSKGQEKAVEYLMDLCKIVDYTEKLTDFCNVVKEINTTMDEDDN